MISRRGEPTFAPEIYSSDALALSESERWAVTLAQLIGGSAVKHQDHWAVEDVEIRLQRVEVEDEGRAQPWVCAIQRPKTSPLSLALVTNRTRAKAWVLTERPWAELLRSTSSTWLLRAEYQTDTERRNFLAVKAKIVG